MFGCFDDPSLLLGAAHWYSWYVCVCDRGKSAGVSELLELVCAWDLLITYKFAKILCKCLGECVILDFLLLSFKLEVQSN